jgi:hypothetical protein
VALDEPLVAVGTAPPITPMMLSSGRPLAE